MTERAEWQGVVGDVWSQEWQRTDRTFAGLAPHLDAAIRAAAPKTGTALEIGCGAGATTLALAAARPDLAITAIDISEGLIRRARERATGAANIAFLVGDASAPPEVVGGYDLAFSRHGVMFFPDPVAAFAAIRARMAPGAPLVFSCIRPIAENPWAAEVAVAATNGAAAPTPAGYVPGPFAFADPAFVEEVLTEAGWRAEEPRAVDYPYLAGAGKDPVGDALEFFARIGPAARALVTVDEAERPAAIERVRAVLERHRRGDVVEFPAAAWIWTAHA